MMQELELEEIDDIYLSKPITKIHLSNHKTQNIRYLCTAMQGWRKSMEDAVINMEMPNGLHLFAVLDGHGGSEVAKVVSIKFPVILQSNKHFGEKNYQLALQESFLEMDDWLVTKEGLNSLVEARFQCPVNEIIQNIKTQKKFKKQLENFGQFQKTSPQQVIEIIGRTIVEQSGCTANVVLIDENKIYCANIGDSRAVCIQNGHAVIMSFDHKPDDIKERQRIQKAGGFVMDGRVCGALSLSRAFGDYQYKGLYQQVIAEPEIMVFKRKDTEMVFIACDGIWESCQSDYGEGIVEGLHKNIKKGVNESDECVKKLMMRLLAPKMNDDTIWGLDNMSCILIELNEQCKQKQNVKQIKKKIQKNKNKNE